jgi:hypothetical protein
MLGYVCSELPGRELAAEQAWGVTLARNSNYNKALLPVTVASPRQSSMWDLPGSIIAAAGIGRHTGSSCHLYSKASATVLPATVTSPARQRSTQ